MRALASHGNGATAGEIGCRQFGWKFDPNGAGVAPPAAGEAVWVPPTKKSPYPPAAPAGEANCGVPTAYAAAAAAPADGYVGVRCCCGWVTALPYAEWTKAAAAPVAIGVWPTEPIGPLLSGAPRIEWIDDGATGGWYGFDEVGKPVSGCCANDDAVGCCGVCCGYSWWCICGWNCCPGPCEAYPPPAIEVDALIDMPPPDIGPVERADIGGAALDIAAPAPPALPPPPPPPPPVALRFFLAAVMTSPGAIANLPSRCCQNLANMPAERKARDLPASTSRNASMLNASSAMPSRDHFIDVAWQPCRRAIISSATMMPIDMSITVTVGRR